MGNKIIQSYRVQIYPEDNDSWKFIRNMEYQCWTGHNMIVNWQSQNDYIPKQLRISHPDATDKEIKEMANEILGCSLQNTTYRRLRKIYPDMPSAVATSLNAQAYAKYRSVRGDIAKGRARLPLQRQGMPIPIQAHALCKFSIQGFTFHKHKFMFRYGRDKSGNEVAVERILDGTYKLKDSKIQIKKKKMFLLMTVEQPVEKHDLDPNIVAGVDLGIKVPAYVAINDGKAHMGVGNGQDILNQRQKIRQQIKVRLKGAAFNRGGKGRKAKLKFLEGIQRKEQNMMNYTNNVISKRIIDFAIKHRAGVIHIEDLSGIKEDANQFILQNWTYSKLQTLIKNKATKHGIEVREIDPRYTSQVCGHCGKFGDMDDRRMFICQNTECDHHKLPYDRDHNAALNIARWTKPIVKEQEK